MELGREAPALDLRRLCCDHPPRMHQERDPAPGRPGPPELLAEVAGEDRVHRRHEEDDEGQEHERHPCGAVEQPARRRRLRHPARDHRPQVRDEPAPGERRGPRSRPPRAHVVRCPADPLAGTASTAARNPPGAQATQHHPVPVPRPWLLSALIRHIRTARRRCEHQQAAERPPAEVEGARRHAGDGRLAAGVDLVDAERPVCGGHGHDHQREQADGHDKVDERRTDRGVRSARTSRAPSNGPVRRRSHRTRTSRSRSD